jgi:hypothetical protein
MRTDRYAAFGLTESDAPFYKAVRDGFKRAGLGHKQLTQTLEWYRDSVQAGMDETALYSSFSEFAQNAGWDASHLVAAQGVYGAIRAQGPESVMSPTPTPEEDRATIERANQLMRTDAAAYWKDEALQEAALEALERQAAPQSGPPALGPPLTDVEIEQRIGRQEMAKFERMMREEPQRYWGSPQLQAAYRDAIERATATPEAEAPAAAPLGVADGVAAAAAEPKDGGSMMGTQGAHSPHSIWRNRAIIGLRTSATGIFS